MRPLLIATLLVGAGAGTAAAQATDGFSAGPGLGDGHDTDLGGDGVIVPSPTYTQDRTFGTTRFWKLDKGQMETEVWWRFRDPRGGGNAYSILQVEYEVGLTDRVQLDIYENLTDESGSWGREGTQIEARIAIDPVYGRTPLNPTIYLEWHPLHLGPARAEGRILLGDSITGDGKLFGAFNLFYEQNVTKSFDGTGGLTSIPNPEVGVTGGASYAVLPDQKLRLGAEAKLAFEKELFDDPAWEKQLLAGPSFVTRIAGDRLKLLGTCLFGITDDAKAVDAYLIVGSMF